MKKYVVSIVWVKQTHKQISITNSLDLYISAESEEDAFNIAFNMNKDLKFCKGHHVNTKSVLKLK